MNTLAEQFMENLNSTDQYHDNAKDYYGKQLETNKDLKTSACCSIEAIPLKHRKCLANIDDEIMEKFYGCGSPLPFALEGLTVLDLGSGSGRDAYLASQLVGPDGFVYGIDMTDEQLAVARKHIDGQMKRFGYSQPNVEFRSGVIEDLGSVGIADNSVDLVISNCVINLSPNKEEVFKEVFRVLKPGGEFYFSDVFASCRIPEALRMDPLLHGECLSGALYIEDFRRMLADLACPDYRVMSSRILEINDKEVEAKLGNIVFYSNTVRAFKLASLEDRREEYGQVATYLGNLEESPDVFRLDDEHLFEAGESCAVCGNTAAMLEETRFSKYFEVKGDRSVHYGLFDCESEEDEEGCCSSDESDEDCCCGPSCC